MSIQANINQTLSIAGFLFQQSAGKELAAKREATKALSSSKTAYNAELEKARRELNIPTDRKLTEKEIQDLRSHPRVAKALEIHEANVSRYAPILGEKEQINEYFKAIEKRAGNPIIDEGEMAEEFWREFDKEHNYNPTSNAETLSTKDEQMADKAATRLEEEQSRLRGENNIDRRKIHRESLREKGRIRAEKKKTGGITNG